MKKSSWAAMAIAVMLVIIGIRVLFGPDAVRWTVLALLIGAALIFDLATIDRWLGTLIRRTKK